MSRCATCGGKVETTVLREQTEDLGGVIVVLRNAVLLHHCHDCGEEMTEIPEAPTLYRAAALARVMTPIQLGAREIRFLRTVLDMTQTEFAEAVEIESAETISRWENGVRGAGGYSEKLIRYGVHALLYKLVPASDCDSETIARMRIKPIAEGRAAPPLVFTRVILKHDHKREETWDALPAAA